MDNYIDTDQALIYSVDLLILKASGVSWLRPVRMWRVQTSRRSFRLVTIRIIHPTFQKLVRSLSFPDIQTVTLRPVTIQIIDRTFPMLFRSLSFPEIHTVTFRPVTIMITHQAEPQKL